MKFSPLFSVKPKLVLHVIPNRFPFVADAPLLNLGFRHEFSPYPPPPFFISNYDPYAFASITALYIVLHFNISVLERSHLCTDAL